MSPFLCLVCSAAGNGVPIVVGAYRWDEIFAGVVLDSESLASQYLECHPFDLLRLLARLYQIREATENLRLPWAYLLLLMLEFLPHDVDIKVSYLKAERAFRFTSGSHFLQRYGYRIKALVKVPRLTR